MAGPRMHRIPCSLTSGLLRAEVQRLTAIRSLIAGWAPLLVPPYDISPLFLDSALTLTSEGWKLDRKQSLSAFSPASCPRSSRESSGRERIQSSVLC